MSKRFLALSVLLVAMLTSMVPFVSADCFSFSVYDSILKTNVDSDGYVDYEGIRAGKGGDLASFLTGAEKADLSSCTELERFSFWINAYNAKMIQMVLKRPSLGKISSDFSLFDEKFTIANLSLSLNDIEHRVIRSDPSKGGAIPGVSLKTFDPRAHFALNCGAVDCPKLLNRAYSADNLIATLEANAEAFANSEKHVSLSKGKITLSSLMKWYGDDFKGVGGVPVYLASLTNPLIRPDALVLNKRLLADYPDKISFQYDWTLNSIKNKKTKRP